MHDIAVLISGLSGALVGLLGSAVTIYNAFHNHRRENAEDTLNAEKLQLKERDDLNEELRTEIKDLTAEADMYRQRWRDAERGYHDLLLAFRKYKKEHK